MELVTPSQRTGRPEVTHTRVSRRISADPTSTALLLAGPTALDLWPGVRRVGEVDGRVLVEAELLGPDHQVRPAAAAVSAQPPRRTPTAYVTRFQWSGPGLPVTTGELVLSYLPDGDGANATRASLVLDSTELGATALDESALAAMAGGFLDNLARAAEARSSAA